MAYTLPEDDASRQERYEESFSTHISARRGSTYPCAQPLLDDLTDSLSPPLGNNQFVGLNQAVVALVDALGPHFPGPPRTPLTAALNRFTASASARSWRADLVFKAFHDLDLIFFRKRLKGNVFLRWAGPREAQGLRREAQLGGREGKARARGWLRDYERVGGGERSVRERIGIYLNAEELLLGGTLMEVWKTLLHCMVHAYLVVMTGRVGDPGDIDGPSFGRCWRAIEYQFPWDLPSALDVHRH